MSDRVARGSAPSLSLVVATRDGWAAYRRCLESHRREIEAVDGELIVMDGSGGSVPDPHELGASVRWESRPGLGVNALRVPGYALARGPIVAQTEDHVMLQPGWAGAVLRAHAEHPSAAAIGGAMDNGSRETLAERASFLLGYSRFVRPFGTARRVGSAAWGIVSFRRDAISGIRDLGGVGVNESIHQRLLARQGRDILMDDRIVGTHIQALTLTEAMSIHFHAGRAMAATRRASAVAVADWLRIVAAPLLPAPITVRVLCITGLRRTYFRDAIATLPVILWLALCRSAGEVIGAIGGPGDSPARLH